MDIIVVTVNYRLTAFGFLQLPFVEDGEETNSNWGFLDQKKALKWVYSNIENFNGDKTRITVAGQSAGGVSTSLHHIHQGRGHCYEVKIIIFLTFSIII